MTTELGLNVVLVDDGDLEYNLENSNFDAMVFSYSCSTAEMDGLKPEEVGILYVGQSAVAYDLATGNGIITGQTEIKITNNDHFITKYESLGNLAVSDLSSNRVWHTGYTNDVVELSQQTDDDTHSMILVIDKGDKLADGTTNAGRRVFFGCYNGDRINDAGWRLFDRSIVWLLKRRAYVAFIVDNKASLDGDKEQGYMTDLISNIGHN